METTFEKRRLNKPCKVLILVCRVKPYLSPIASKDFTDSSQLRLYAHTKRKIFVELRPIFLQFAAAVLVKICAMALRAAAASESLEYGPVKQNK
ncbi:MAG: hypothetical protein JSW66_00410 [Phycisphaerales bacterium]|nr:MAG: hypothetical protein JSW66_00410 [Phycisphaerales bacterium]